MESFQNQGSSTRKFNWKETFQTNYSVKTTLNEDSSAVTMGFPSGSDDKRIHLPMQETRVQPLGREDPLEKEMAPDSSILAWRIPWTEFGGLQSMGSQRIRHD